MVRTFQEAYKTIRCLQLYITMLNEVNRYLIFKAKLYCIGGSIWSCYAAIAHVREYPIHLKVDIRPYRIT